MELEILARFRDIDNPKIGSINDRNISTLKKQELIDECQKMDLDVLKLCRLGNIDPIEENLVKMLQHTLDVKKKLGKRPAAQAGCSGKNSGETPEKKQKTYEMLAEKIESLEGQLKEKQKNDDISEFERLRRETKELAAKPSVAFHLRSWEKDIKLRFDPLESSTRRVSFVHLDGNNVKDGQYPLPAETAYAKKHLPNINNIRFQNHKQFVSGQIHTRLSEWEKITKANKGPSEVLDWLKNGIDISYFMIRFQGKFWGKTYDSDSPPARIFSNANNCKHFVEFINNTVHERLANGSIQCLGKVGECCPPHIVAPLTVEPSKPRLCINLMFLNNWIRDIHFSLDTLKDVPRVVMKEAYFTSLDDKSGFDNVKLNANSYKFVGFQWAGYYFCFKTLPFGFKLSSYIYHTLNLQATYYIRREFNIPMFLYIDDRLIEQVRNEPQFTGEKAALFANYLVCEVLTRLGYCLNLDKSHFRPTQKPEFLGFVIDSVEGCFHITEAKKGKFMTYRDLLLSKQFISVLELQKLSGKAISFMLAVPAAKLYIREMNLAISRGIKGGQIIMSGTLREEIEYWRFLDHWEGKVAWKSERHLKIDLYTDASLFKYGGVVNLSETPVDISDFWGEELKGKPIMVLEGYALLNVLRAVKKHILSHRVDAYVDSMVLLNAWNNQGCKSQEMNFVIKEIFQFTLENDIMLNMFFVPSKQNLADAPSRSLQRMDAMISKPVWDKIQFYFGGKRGHSVDLMAIDSNCMSDKLGGKLKHFTPYPTPNSSGVNMFCQAISTSENCYVFPPFSLILPVIKFLIECKLYCTILLPLTCAIPHWFPEILPFVQDAFIVGYKGEQGVIKLPSRSGFIPDLIGLRENLWAVRIMSCRSTDNNVWPWGKRLLSSSPGISRASHFICVGDSMIRFLLTDNRFNNPLVHVFSVGGALISGVIGHMLQLAGQFPPKVLLVHVGVNNLSKTWLHRCEYDQLSSTCSELELLESSLLSLKRVHENMQVILSSIVVTKDSHINARADVINSRVQDICARNNWSYLNNDAIQTTHLRDTVHLNMDGEQVFVNHLLTSMKSHV